MKRILVWMGVYTLATSLLSACSVNSNEDNVAKKFKNSEVEYSTSISIFWSIAKAYWNDKRTDAKPAYSLPLISLTTEMLTSIKDDAVVRLGHSTLLLKIDGEFILLDPVFSERASFVQWLGPKRFHPSPISIDALPPLKAVIISHDHYDHLDKDAIKKLAAKADYFVTPLKVGAYLKDWGVDEQKITELDWWQDTQIGQLKLTATPSQHFSGRGLFDGNGSLWASWVISGTSSKIFFSGDSGYFSGFKEIGEKYGPFDLTLIEAGAYNGLWPDVHMMPEESVQAHIDLQGINMMPIHNGTFDLSLHNWFEPLEQISQIAQQNNVSVLTPVFGQALSIKQPQQTQTWWRQ